MNGHLEHPQRQARHSAATLLAAAALSAGLASASLAQGLPGIVVMAPPSMPGQAPQMPPQMMAPPMSAPAPAPAPPAAVAKPKPKPKPKPAAVADVADDAKGTASGGTATSGIAILVNGDPITAYQIDQRAKLLALQSDIGSRAKEQMKRFAQSESVNVRWKQIVEETVKANEGKTREQIMAIIQEKQKTYMMGLQKQAMEGARASVLPGLRDKARTELIEELVKLQEAQRGGVTAEEAAIDGVVKEIAGRNNLTPQQFAQHFAGMGVEMATFKAKFRAQQAWVEAVRKKFGHLVNPNNRDIDKLLQKDDAGEDQLELQLHRIIVSIPPQLDQRAMAQRMAEAEQIQRNFAGCKSTNGLAGKVEGARFENMGARKPGNFPEPTRTMLLNAKDEEMIPPSMTSGGIELLAVCSRQVVKANEEKRRTKSNELRQDEFERLSRKHLRDLMADAIVENR